MAKFHFLNKPENNFKNNMEQNKCYQRKQTIPDILHYNQENIVSSHNASESFAHFFQKHNSDENYNPNFITHRSSNNKVPEIVYT